MVIDIWTDRLAVFAVGMVHAKAARCGVALLSCALNPPTASVALLVPA